MSKKFLKLSRACLLTFLVFGSLGAFAGTMTPLSIGLAPPVMFPPRNFTITGLRMSVLWGSHQYMYGLDLGGIGNITKYDFNGIAVSGIFNRTEGVTNIYGLQAAGILNSNMQKLKLVGLQVATVNSNIAASTITGFQLALLNLGTYTKIYGIQAGIYNRADEVYGFQIGLINVVTTLHGMQIGFINFYTTGTFIVCPFLNFGF